MQPPAQEKLRRSLAQGDWQQAIGVLQTTDPESAAAWVLSAPFEEQQALFRHLPIALAAKLAAELPYYQTYVLLHSRPADEMKAIVEQMDPNDRMQFLDELPEEAWQELTDELS